MGTIDTFWEVFAAATEARGVFDDLAESILRTLRFELVDAAVCRVALAEWGMIEVGGVTKEVRS